MSTEDLKAEVAKAEADMAASIGTPAWDKAYARKDAAEHELWKRGEVGVTGALSVEEFKAQFGSSR